MNRVVGIKIFTGLMGDGSLDDHSSKWKEFEGRLKIVYEMTKHFIPQLKESVAQFTVAAENSLDREKAVGGASERIPNHAPPLFTQP